ncbi:MAG: DNA gyrase inhibitor YacG [Methylotenera sp.]|nr:DNA gyrase inhibitor YacG [Methylotenera sp.]
MVNTKKKLVACPTCKQLAEFSPDNVFRPFCSNRCKLIDLGLWASEGYTIPVEAKTDQLPDDFTPQ